MCDALCRAERGLQRGVVVVVVVVVAIVKLVVSGVSLERAPREIRAEALELRRAVAELRVEICALCVVLGSCARAQLFESRSPEL